MASSIPHHYYSNYTSDHFTTQQGLSSHNNNNIINTSILDNTMMWGCQENLMPVFDNYGAFDQIVSLDCDTMSSSGAWIHPNFVEQQDFAVPALLSDCKLGFYGGGIPNFNGRYNNQPPIGHEFVEDQCCGFVEDIKPPPPYPNVARENWGIQSNQITTVEEPNIKVGRYSEEERKERILRYLKKRNQRNFNKTIKYACRKTLADRRVRVRGRFARNNEICEEDHMATKKLENHHDDHINDDFYGSDSFQFQLKNEEEDWLQEAMASLVYLSHSSPDDM
ncbi:CCT motif family protein [Trifolium repens]|nr:CCT motif family protein [Trifolium repens]